MVVASFFLPLDSMSTLISINLPTERANNLGIFGDRIRNQSIPSHSLFPFSSHPLRRLCFQLTFKYSHTHTHTYTKDEPVSLHYDGHDDTHSRRGRHLGGHLGSGFVKRRVDAAGSRRADPVGCVVQLTRLRFQQHLRAIRRAAVRSVRGSHRIFPRNGLGAHERVFEALPLHSRRDTAVDTSQKQHRRTDKPLTFNGKLLPTATATATAMHDIRRFKQQRCPQSNSHINTLNHYRSAATCTARQQLDSGIYSNGPQASHGAWVDIFKRTTSTRWDWLDQIDILSPRRSSSSA